MLNKKKLVAITQPEYGRHIICMTMDLVYSIYVSIPSVKVFKGSTDKGFMCVISL